MPVTSCIPAARFAKMHTLKHSHQCVQSCLRVSVLLLYLNLKSYNAMNYKDLNHLQILLEGFAGLAVRHRVNVVHVGV